MSDANALWPLGTRFYVRSGTSTQVWTVDHERDRPNSILSPVDPLGTALLTHKIGEEFYVPDSDAPNVFNRYEIVHVRLPVDPLVKKYRGNPEGIRYDRTMQDTCLRCGSQDAHPRASQPWYNRTCKRCRTRWYVNHCWNCDDRVDSRDPKTPQCHICGWYRCNSCDACEEGGLCPRFSKIWPPLTLGNL